MNSCFILYANMTLHIINYGDYVAIYTQVDVHTLYLPFVVILQPDKTYPMN